MKPRRTLIAAFYALCAFLVMGSVLQALLPVWPPRPGDVQWRFAAVGVLSRSILPGLMGISIGVAVAFLLSHARVLRALSVVSAVAAIALFAGSGLFILDALTLRNTVRPEVARAYDLAILHSLITLVSAAAVLALVGIGAWRTPRPRVQMTPLVSVPRAQRAGEP